MNLSYERIKSKMESGGGQWTSYADLSFVLAFVFLLLYMIANMRTTTMTVANQTELQEAKKEVANLKQQISVFESMRDDYLKQGASTDEIALYNEIVQKMDLLEDQTKNEKRELAKQVREMSEKERELNRYQQIVKNLITAKLTSSSRLKARDQIIEEKSQNIEELNKSVREKEQIIATNSKEIETIKSDLEKNIEKLKKTQKRGAISKKKLQEQIAMLKLESDEKIKSYEASTAEIKETLEETRKIAEQNEKQAQVLSQTLEMKQRDFDATVQKLQQDHEKFLEQEKARYAAKLERERSLGAKEKQQAEREYQELIAARTKEYQGRLKQMESQVGLAKSEMSSLSEAYKKSVASLSSANQELQKDLDASRQREIERQKLAEQLKGNFAAAGLKADIDPKTGEVTIHFGEEYFDTDAANLKPGMKSKLEKMMPVYAKSLFQNSNIADKIGSVEIVGFASPTFRGKFVDPKSLGAKERAAVKYNMDLSYMRARSIFSYAFNTNRMKFDYQDQLFPLVKVSGRSYLATPGSSRDPAEASGGKRTDFCSKHDCKKAQKVLIRFNLKNE